MVWRKTSIQNKTWVFLFIFFQITQAELASIVSSMGKVKVLAASGTRLGGEKYMYISSTDEILRCKKGTGGFHAAKSKTTLIIGIYDDTIQPAQAATVVEKMADYLSANNC